MGRASHLGRRRAARLALSGGWRCAAAELRSRFSAAPWRARQSCAPAAGGQRGRRASPALRPVDTDRRKGPGAPPGGGIRAPELRGAGGGGGLPRLAPPSIRIVKRARAPFGAQPPPHRLVDVL